MSETIETETTETEASERPPKRYDILLVSQNRQHTVIEQGLKSLINYLQATNIIRVNDEAVAKEWVEVYAKQGPTAHDMFVRGVYDSDLPTFFEVAVRGGTRACFIPFGGEENEGCFFWMEVRGCLFQEINGKYKTKLNQVMSTRFDYFVREHVALPPHLTVPPDELPEEKKYARRDSASPRVGTAVEEF
jgi:hypothetical protein